MYKCPCCGKPGLTYSDAYYICEICGWEDDPWMEEYIYDPSSANQGLSMVDYRELYLQKKAEDPE